ncbi:PAS domain S-box protein [Algibacter pacificus]|uniref:PAS domain S-box protein n=1 Tax=Algibacter pacificus TaxID=2599389 RepID=UPI0011C7B6AB|nr:PAS domain S-box protein [Algibacter pacificus]
MKKTENIIKKAHLIFVFSIVLVAIPVFVFVQKSVNTQVLNTNFISNLDKEIALSHRLSDLAFISRLDANDVYLSELKVIEKKWDSIHSVLKSISKQQKIQFKVNSQLENNKVYFKQMLSSCQKNIENSNSILLKEQLKDVLEKEKNYLKNAEVLMHTYQNKSEEHLQKFKNTLYIIAVIIFVIMVVYFLFILKPVLSNLLKQNINLSQLNEDLALSKSKLKQSLLDLEKLKTDLELKEALNRDFIAQTPTAIAMLDKNMCYIAASKKWVSDYKMEGQEIIGRSHYDLFPEISDDWKANHQKCLSGAIDKCEEAPFIRKDGSVQWIYWDVRPWYISEDNIGGLIMHTGDITHIKEKEDLKKRNDKILEKTNEIARIGTWDVDLVKNTVFWSKVVLEIHEVPEGFVPELETAINFFKEGKSRETIAEAVKLAIEQGQPYDVEVELVTLKGNVIWTRAIGQADMVNGRCVRIYGVFQDINKIKRSQIALNNAHRELKAIFNSGVIGIVSAGTDGIINHFNRGAEILTGYSASEMVGLQRPKYYHLQEELDRFRFDIAELYGKNPVGLSPSLELSKHNAYDTREWTYLRKDGSTIPVQLTLSPIKNENGKLIGYLGVSTDISDKKVVQNELLRKNQLLNFAEKITLMGHWIWDTVSDKVEWSRNLYNIFGLDTSVDALNFDTYFNFVHPEDKDSVIKYFDNTREDKSLKRFTHRIIAGDGTLKIIQLLGEVITDNSGDVIEMIGTCQDVTEQRMTENELLRKNQILNFAEEITLLGNWQADIINDFVKWSKNMYHIFGVHEDTFTTLDTYVNFTHPEDKDRVALHMRKTIEQKEFTELVHRILLSDGTIKIVKLLGKVITDIHEQVTEVIGTCQDVTAQKLAETDLLRKNHFLSCAERITKMGNWQWDVVTDTLKWSTNLYKIYEYDEKLTNLTYDTFFSQVHPDDKDYITTYVQNSFIEKKFPDNFIHRIVTCSGKIKTVHYLGEVILNEQGEVIEMMGTCQDITEQKMEENKFRGLLESAPDAMVIVDENDKIQLINKEAEKLFGYKIDELLNKSVEMLIPKRYGEMHIEHRKGFFGDPKNRLEGARKELYGINKQGQEIPIQISLSPLQTEQGLLLSAAIRDITAQKKAENEILRKNQLLTFAEKITMMGNWQWDIVTNKVEWSSNLFTIFQIPENTELCYNTYFNFVCEEDKERVTKYIGKTIIDKSPLNLTHKIVLTNGTVKTIQLLAKVVTDSQGNVIELLGTCQDVTAQKMAENKFRGLLESAPDAMVIINEDSNIQLINKQAEKLFGYKIEEIYNKSVDLLLPKRYLDNHEYQRQSFFKTPKTISFSDKRELFAIAKSGKEFPIQLGLSPLKTEEGILVSAVVRDITEQKASRNKIIKAKNDLEILTKRLIKNNNQLADFAHITSHNLRAPVSNLNSLLGLYNTSTNEDDKKMFFEKFENVILHLTLTLNTLVDAIRIKNNTSHKFEEVTFSKVLSKTEDILTGEILKSGAIITSDFSEISKIKYDRIYLESIFLNLVGNSIKYRSKDRIPKIDIKSKIIDGKIKLMFKDNGLGIDLERHGHKLFGLNKVFHRHPEAKGVGLFMVKTQVEALNGTIYATSEVNKGTVFNINFNELSNYEE